VRRLNDRIALAAIATLAFALRAAWVIYSSFTPNIGDDTGRYDLLGRSLATGGGFINPNGTTTLFWPPGYPFLLTAVYKLYPERLLGNHEVAAALLVNALLAAASVLLVYAIGRRAFNGRVGLLGALLFACFPSLIFLSGVTLSETLFTFLVLLGIWLIVEAELRPNRLLLIPAGLVIGYAALTRGQAALLPLVAVPFWWRANGSWRPALVRLVVVGGLAALTVLPWTVRNYVESNSLVPISANAGVDFYIGHSAGADGGARKVDELVLQYGDLPQPQADAKIDAEGFRKGLKYAVGHPLREVELSARKLFYLYYNDHEALRWTEAHGAMQFLSAGLRDVLAFGSDVYYLAALALAAAGIGGWLSWRHPVRLLLVSLVVYWTLVHVAFFADPRFHAPMMPVVCLWAALGVYAAQRWWAGHAAGEKVLR
jgi:4-amino-4-deoxy-L-arabinose transferase-like glycosyltransferase